MNRDVVESILQMLKTSTDKNVIVRGLIKLRTDLVKDANGIELFLECGGIQPMVRFLSKPHEQILEVVLSILANCCTNKACCQKAMESNVSVHVATILKSVLNPVIQCRACRLLGNLGKYDHDRLLGNHCAVIAQTLCQIIKDTSDVNTRIMALRASRFLLANVQFVKYFLDSNGLVIILQLLSSVMRKEGYQEKQELERAKILPTPVGLKQNEHREKYFLEVARHLEGVRSDIFDHQVLKDSVRSCDAYELPKGNEALEVATEIMKCLLVMSDLKIDYLYWQSLIRNCCTFDPIVSIVTGEHKQRNVALKILSSFSKNSGAFYVLSSTDAIVAACDLLVSPNLERPLNESETRHCINIACMLSADACNRSKIRRSGAIRKLIAMVRESDSKTEISSILYLLNHFEYDNMSMDLMLREGLISVLIKQLNIYLTSDDEYHKKKRLEKQQQAAKKRKLLGENNSEHAKKIARVRRDSVAFDFDSPSNSPNYCMSSPSPSSSRSMSPVGKEYDFADPLSDDESYSPACSDDESEDTKSGNTAAPDSNTMETESSDIMKLLDIACSRPEAIEDNILDKEDDDISQSVQDAKLPQLVDSPRSTIDIIENLLLRVTLLTDKRRELGKPETMNTLIKAIHTFGCHNHFAVSLTNILLESQFFAQVIKHGIVHQLYQLTKIPEMQKVGYGFLETLTCVGESNYGKAELARMLNAADVTEDQTRAAICVAYIIKDQRLLYQFLKNGNGLTRLLGVIIDDNSDYVDEAVDAFTSLMGNTLGISVPQHWQSEEHDEFADQGDILLPTGQCDMRFIVDEAVPPDGAVEEATTAPAESGTKALVTIEFNKKLLCDNSDVFNTMLNSDFREGNEGEIHLSTYTPNGLRYFLNLIVCQSGDKQASLPKPKHYYALLEAFELARVYIIPSMEQSLQDMLIGLLDEHNCLRLLEWSLKNYHAELTDVAINYYLCASLPTASKVRLFREANDSKFAKQWYDMLVCTVYVHCTSG